MKRVSLIAPSLFSLFCLVSLLVTSACSKSPTLGPDGEPEAKEIKAKTKSSLDLPEHELFLNAKRQYQTGLYSISRDSFTAIKDNYPTGPFAEFAELKIADTFFQNREYQSAATSYEEFSKNRPASSALPYALLRAGRSYELSSSGIGRDPTPLQKSLETYNSLIERFPESVYCSSARYYKQGVEDLLATYARDLIAFYQDREKQSASNVRDEEFQKKFGSKSSDFEPSNYDKRASLALKPLPEDKLLEAKNVLKQFDPPSPPDQSNSMKPSTENNSPPIQVVAKANLPINTLPRLRPTPMPSNPVPSNPELSKSTIQVVSVSCDQSRNQILFNLSSELAIDQSALNVTGNEKGIELKIDKLDTAGRKTQNYSCFSESDIAISQSGVISIKSPAVGAKAIYLKNPARIALSLIMPRTSNSHLFQNYSSHAPARSWPRTVN